VLNVRPTNSTSSRLSYIGSAVSFGRGRKSFVFVLQMVFLDDSVGNNTLRKWEHWLGGTKSGSWRSYIWVRRVFFLGGGANFNGSTEARVLQGSKTTPHRGTSRETSHNAGC